MTQNAPVDADQVLQIVYFIAEAVLAMTLITVSWLLREGFGNILLKKPKFNSRDEFLRTGWGFMLAETICGLQVLNVTLYILINSGPPLMAKFILDNTPHKTNELIMLLCYLLLIPLIVRWAKSSPTGSSTTQ
jgi:hypothetical protein